MGTGILETRLGCESYFCGSMLQMRGVVMPTRRRMAQGPPSHPSCSVPKASPISTKPTMLLPATSDTPRQIVRTLANSSMCTYKKPCPVATSEYSDNYQTSVKQLDTEAYQQGRSTWVNDFHTTIQVSRRSAQVAKPPPLSQNSNRFWAVAQLYHAASGSTPAACALYRIHQSDPITLWLIGEAYVACIMQLSSVASN
jgi:hypothetical protein